MKNLKIDVISKYLRPYKKEFLYGALALFLVNILSVVIPLEVKNIIDQLQNGFSSEFVLSKSLWLIFLATCMGLIRLFSRQIVFGIGRKVEVNLRQKLFEHVDAGYHVVGMKAVDAPDIDVVTGKKTNE